MSIEILSFKLLQKFIMRNVLLISVLAMSAQSLANTSNELTPFQAGYYATFDGFSGNTSTALTFDSERDEYLYESVTRPRGLARLMGKIRESSSFMIAHQKIHPLAFSHNSRDRENIKFDWDNKMIHSVSDKAPASLEMNGSEYDLLSLQMQLMLDLKNSALNDTYNVVKDNGIKQYNINELAEEILSINDQSYNTIKVKQQRTGSSRHTLMWFAPEMDYVVVKIEQYKNDKKRGTLIMTSYKAITQDMSKESENEPSLEPPKKKSALTKLKS